MNRVAKNILCSACCFMLSVQLFSQTVSNGTLDYLFERNVKSIDEFINRFNGTEANPDIPNDSLSRRNNILALFNPDMDTNGRNKEDFRKFVFDFADKSVAWQGKINIASENTFMELPCDFSVNRKQFRATLLLKRENDNKGNSRWAIVGIRGLLEAGLYSTKFTGISPVDHEMEFVGLSDLFNLNKRLVPAMTSQYRNIDELSLFLGLIQSPDFKFIGSRDLKVHILDIPGYILSLSKSSKDYDMGSWFINRLDTAGELNKLEYINKLFGIK